MKITKPYATAAILFFILIQLLLFIRLNRAEILWKSNEILGHRVFWSMNGVDDFGFHTGLRGGDWKKVFYADHVEGAVRFRQFSYLTEMLSFKTWQWLEAGYFRDYTLIGLHVINALLLGWLTWRLSGNVLAACLAAGLLLNAGTPLATLMYPFRNAKMLVTLLFLMSWIHTTYGRRWGILIALQFLMLLTDEVAFLLIPLQYAMLWLTDKDKKIPRQLFWSGPLGLAVLFGLWAGGVWYFNQHVVNAAALEHTREAYFPYAAKVLGYWTQSQSYLDVFHSLGIFVRRNFGSWDMSATGLVGVIGFLGWLAVLVFRGSRDHIKLTILIGLWILFKAVLHPHHHVHAGLMPSGTTFPSLFFFGYYHNYSVVVLLILLLALSLARRMTTGVFVLAATATVLMSWSNVEHMREGPAEVLAFHQDDEPQRQAIVTNLHGLQKYMEKRDGSIYISFPSGPLPQIRGRIFDEYQFLTPRYVTTMFLRALEDGRLVTSLTNVPPAKARASHEELNIADYFYDVRSRQEVNLARVRESVGASAWHPVIFGGPGAGQARIQFKIRPGDRELIFFVKGMVRGVIGVSGQRIQIRQNYGYAYQLFRLSLDQIQNTAMIEIVLQSDPGWETALVGPFVRGTDGYREVIP